MDPVLMERFQISETFGFILPNNLKQLPEKFQHWNVLVADLPHLLDTKTLRDKVKQLPLLDASSLKTLPELYLAHSILAFLSNGYVWQNGDEGVVKVLPKQLAVPICLVSDKLGLPPGLCYTDHTLSNWCKKDENGPVTFENIDIVRYFEDVKESIGLLKPTWLAEFAFSSAIKYIFQGLKDAEEKTIPGLRQCLEEVAKAVDAMIQGFATTHDLMTPEPFYAKVFNYLAGWNFEGSRLPGELVYEGVTSDKPKVVGNANAAVSSSIQTADAFLGIKHDPSHVEKNLFWRKFMPPPHVDFIQYVEKRSKVKAVVEGSSDNLLRDAYAKAVEAVRNFRSYHIQVVVKYMVSVEGKRKKATDSQEESLGPGQSSLPYLKSMRDETV